jgi:hypothetical protein
MIKISFHVLSNGFFFCLIAVCVKPGFKNIFKGISWSSLNRGVVICGSSSSNSNADADLKISRRKSSGVPASSSNGVEPFNGKSGSVSFHGLTHQSVEEGRLVSAPFNEEKGSFVWLLGPVALVLSLIVPQFFLGSAIEAFLKDEVLVGTYQFEFLQYLLLKSGVELEYLTEHKKEMRKLTAS